MFNKMFLKNIFLVFYGSVACAIFWRTPRFLKARMTCQANWHFWSDKMRTISDDSCTSIHVKDWPAQGEPILFCNIRALRYILTVCTVCHRPSYRQDGRNHKVKFCKKSIWFSTLSFGRTPTLIIVCGTTGGTWDHIIGTFHCWLTLLLCIF